MFSNDESYQLEKELEGLERQYFDLETHTTKVEEQLVEARGDVEEARGDAAVARNELDSAQRKLRQVEGIVAGFFEWNRQTVEKHGTISVESVALEASEALVAIERVVKGED